MRLRAIHAKDIQPIKNFEIDNLSDVVVIAGPNGVGKSRMLDWLVQHIRNLQPNPNQWVQVEATCPEELNAWEKPLLDTRNNEDCQKLRNILQRQKKRSDQKSSLLMFESDRTISNIQPYQFTWDFTDPWAEQVGWEVGFNRLKDRFNDTIQSIFRKKRSRREQIMAELEQREVALKAAGANKDAPGNAQKNITIDIAQYPDPLEPFATAFRQLLGPKEWVDPDERRQQLFFRDRSNQWPISQLSSGEKEVLNIVFDFLLRNPSDSIVIFDEPELHLHPELSYKLIQTLKSSGARNQFILCTHSADIITAALDNSVVFVAPSTDEGRNQAVPVSEDDATHQALKLIGQSIGVISLGKRIVLIEGEHGSLDKQTYGSILKGRFPNLVLVPSGGKATIRSFDTLTKTVLENTLWGVDFFMVCDHDAVTIGSDIGAMEAEARGRLRLLKRYHLENYFLDEAVIVGIFENLEPANSPLRDKARVAQMLVDVAKEQVSYAAALIVSSAVRERAGNVDVMPKAANGKTLDEIGAAIIAEAATERGRLEGELEADKIRDLVRITVERLTNSLNDGSEEWKSLMPGRVILKVFCSRYAKLDFGRFKNAYLEMAAKDDNGPFKEVIEIFDGFSKM